MSLQETIRHFFFLDHPGDAQALAEEITDQNMARIKPVAILTIAVEALLFVRSLLLVLLEGAGGMIFAYMIMYLLMALSMSILLILVRVYCKDQSAALAWARFVAPSGAWLSLIWAVATTLMDMSGSEKSSTVLIAMQYLLMAFLLMPPYMSLIITLTVQVAFAAAVFILFPNPQEYFGLLLNTLINGALAWLVSRLMYETNYMQFLSNRTVLEKNEQLSSLNAELAELSITDALTRLMNRRRFDEIAEQEWRRACREEQRLTLAIADVDDFKQFNDIYGHQKGDECLRSVADSLSSELRRATETVARFGGEEFIILLRSESAQSDQRSLMRIKDAVERLGIPHSGSRAGPVVTISLGAYSFLPLSGENYESMFRVADAALYEAKAAGRNRLVYKTDGEAAGED